MRTIMLGFLILCFLPVRSEAQTVLVRSTFSCGSGITQSTNNEIVFFSFLVALVPMASLTQTDPCDDLGGIDFGDCEAVLGWGMIDGSCTLIIGCSSPVPLFVTQAACEEACIPQPTCDDLANVDFGPCAMVLGYGVISGECVLISGCESPVPLFTTAEECLLECEAVATEAANWGILKARYR